MKLILVALLVGIAIADETDKKKGDCDNWATKGENAPYYVQRPCLKDEDKKGLFTASLTEKKELSASAETALLKIISNSAEDLAKNLKKQGESVENNVAVYAAKKLLAAKEEIIFRTFFVSDIPDTEKDTDQPALLAGDSKGQNPEKESFYFLIVKLGKDAYQVVPNDAINTTTLSANIKKGIKAAVDEDEKLKGVSVEVKKTEGDDDGDTTTTSEPTTVQTTTEGKSDGTTTEKGSTASGGGSTATVGSTQASGSTASAGGSTATAGSTQASGSTASAGGSTATAGSTQASGSTTPSPEKKSKPFPVWAIILIVVAIIAVVGGVAVYVMKMRRQSDSRYMGR